MKRKWNKNCKNIMAAILLWVCVFWPLESQAQTDVATGVYPVYMVDSSKEAEYFGPGVCVNYGGTPFVLAGPYDESRQVVAMAVGIEDQVLLLDYAGSSASISMWIINEDSLPELAGYENMFLTPGFFSQNERAVAYYHCVSDGELALGGTEIILQGINSDGYLVAEGYPTNVLYPASVVNGQGQIVGILEGDNVCEPLGEQSGQAESEAMATAPPLPDRGTGSSVSTGGGAASNVSHNGSWVILLLLALGVILVVVLVILIIVLAGKKKPSPGNDQPVTPGTSGNRGKTAPAGREEKPVSGEGQQTSKLWLLAKGGCMNGRVYPVEQNEITIGRDATMVIRFPADTAGVSRIHAKLYWQGDQLMLMDCNSTSGTFLKRQGKLTPMAPVAVQSGDVFYIGEKANSFEISTGR